MTRILAAWTAGSRLHGIADPDSDTDLIILVAPTPDHILLGDTGHTTSLNAPDAVILDPVALLHGVTKGSPNMLEWLDAPDDSLLADTGAFALLRDARPTPIGAATLRMLDGNIRANLHRLDKPMPRDRRRFKLEAETLRLAWAREQAAETGRLPARLDETRRDTLRRIRQGGQPWEATRRMLPAPQAPPGTLPEHADATRYREATVTLMRALADGRAPTLPYIAVAGVHR